MLHRLGNTCLCVTLPAMIDPAKIEAGRELDRLIAEKVIGLTPGEPIPSYSTDIAAAWTVVETMVHKDGVYFGAPHFKHKHQSLAALGYPEGTECWYCVINTKLLNKVVLCADTAPLAIGRAALLWALKHGPKAPEGNREFRVVKGIQGFLICGD